MVKVSPATSAATFERTPMVTRTASQTTPKKVSKLAGWAEVWAVTRKPPPMPATRAPRPATMIFICTTLMPSVRAPGCAPADGVEGQPRGRAPEIQDEQGHDGEGHQAHVGEGGVGRGEGGRATFTPRPWFVKMPAG